MIDTDRLNEAIDGSGDLLMRGGFVVLGLGLALGIVGASFAGSVVRIGLAVLVFGTIWSLFVDYDDRA